MWPNGYLFLEHGNETLGSKETENTFVLVSAVLIVWGDIKGTGKKENPGIQFAVMKGMPC
jgi:hypothetical protein